MKVAALILAIVFSSFTKTSAPRIENVYGVWKGYYGTETEINEIVIRINPQNSIEVFNSTEETCPVSGGSYKLVGDSAIIISGILVDKRPSEVIMYGNFNRTINFMDGNWDGKDKDEKGCFYLQKQFVKINL